MAGDHLSIAVVYFNLHGRNFDVKLTPVSDHADWLSYMSSSNKFDLANGSKVVRKSANGTVLSTCTIGEAFAAA